MNMNIDDGDARGVTGLATEFVLSLPRWLGFGRRHEHSLVTTAKGAGSLVCRFGFGLRCSNGEGRKCSAIFKKSNPRNRYH